ncbi:MAG TPA: hypothetical protein VIY69_18350, partial [Candidatus Acidoferrales bacterium]
APRLTPKEIDLLHRVWLQLSDQFPNREIHHHDIVHFALDELEREIGNGCNNEVIERLGQHIEQIEHHRTNS